MIGPAAANAAAADLVIAIGNRLRGDDGVGPFLVEHLQMPAVQIRTVHQLTPDLAPELVGAERVLFVDAWQAPAGARPCLRPLQPSGDGTTVESHRLEPAQLLQVAELLFGGVVAAQELLVPAFAFAHGEQFSAELRRQLPAARRLLHDWLQQAGGSDDA
jgi:hydrogenase maturation protease